MFLCLFGYLMLCEFKYYGIRSNSTKIMNYQIQNSTSNITFKEISSKIVAKPHFLEYTLIGWVLTFIIEELRQFVILKFKKFKNIFFI